MYSFGPYSSRPYSAISDVLNTDGSVTFVGMVEIEAIINTPLAQIMGDPSIRFVIAAEINILPLQG